MFVQETILCATAVASSSNPGSGSGSISIHDIQTGNSLSSFKQINAAPNCTSFLQTSSVEGGFVLAAQPDKSILNVYGFQKDQLHSKMVLPEKLTCTALDPQGNYFAGGTAAGRIYLWEVASGIMFNAWDAHYRQVNVLRFTSDGSALISGSDDSGVSVWLIARLLDHDHQSELVTPHFTLSDHTLPVTDIACGVGKFPRCRVLTSSKDHSVKIWDLSSRSLLTTFHLPKAPTCLVWDPTERSFFAASSEGSIFQVNLFRHRENKYPEAVGGGSVSDVIRIEAEKKRHIQVGHPITCMTLSLNCSLLLVGTSTGAIHVYDVPTRQLLRTINTHKGMVITYLATMLKPPDLVGHISLNLHIGSSVDAKDVLPMKPVAAFQRVRDVKARQAHEVSMLLGGHSIVDEDKFMGDMLQQHHAFFVQPAGASEASGPGSAGQQAKIASLEAELERMREQLAKAKGVNDMMWETVVRRVVQPDGQSAAQEESERSGKKSRLS